MPGREANNLAAVIARRAQLAGVLLLGCVSLAVAADRAAELSDEFLEYLGSLEGDDESWMDFTADSAAKESVKPSLNSGSNGKVVASANSSASSRAQPLPQAASANPSAASKAGEVKK